MLEINNLTNFKLDQKSFSQVAKKVLSGENKGIKNISLALVEKKEMRELNKKHRGKDVSTDVLAFGENPRSEFINPSLNYLGEIVICPDVVKGNAEKYGNAERQEMLKVFVHGILHLLGYDHEQSQKEAEKMEQKEKFYLANV